MNLTISKEQLLNGLQAVQNVVSARTTLPVLSNVLMQAEGKGVKFIATDLDVTVSCCVEANVTKAGSTTLPVKKLFSIARELNGAEIELTVDDKNVSSISCGSSFYRIHGLPPEEFPPLRNFTDDKSVQVEQKALKGMLKKTSFAMSVDEARYVLNGIFISCKEHKMTVVATDGRRLALTDEEVDFSEKSQGEFIIPAKAVNELNRLLQDKGEVTIKYTENQAEFSLADENASSVVIVTKLIEGNYPNYRQVIPSEAKERISLPREEFLHALKRAEIMTSDKTNSVKLTFGKNNLAITANSPEIGEARESLAINYKGRDLAIAFNPKYMIEALNALPNEEVFIELVDELSPGVIKINGPFLYVVMPMRLG
ncbi:MAG TPA: DNA polymerase III subunit beta [Verrucomicrobiota bacterium]|nr:DNA polymerase III subunit beta [Verrucomicrobiota bacterium]HNT15964.1 DNA polymerase III subunit beta [Verrucomicrobiota bacterium]